MPGSMTKKKSLGRPAPMGSHPRSAHIREAKGGFILSKHGGDKESFMGEDHVAPDVESAIAALKEHMGGGEAGESPKESMKEGKRVTARGEKDADAPKVKKRKTSETY